MNEKLLALGCVMLLMGIFTYTYADARLDEYDSFSGQLEQAFDDSARQDYRNWSLARSAGAASAPVGLILVFASFVPDLGRLGN